MKRILLLLLLVLPMSLAAQAQSLPQSREQVTLSFAPLVKRVAPAVVNIYTKKLVRQRVSPLFEDPFFRQFFGEVTPQGLTRQRMENSLGSGVIVRPDGFVVTSRHVIDGADEIRVVLADRREFDAKVALSDEHTDLALLRLQSGGETFPCLELKDSDEAQVGDLVLAIGNPFGVGQTVTSGIVSALTHKAVGAGDVDYFIQTDAAINPGNSGGALVTMDGKLVGINASIYSRDGGNMGIGFAVPSNLVRVMIAAASSGKRDVAHSWTGLDAQDVTPDIAASLGLAQPQGLIIKKMNPLSPFAKAGARVGDVILSVDGRTVEDVQAFRYRVATVQPGTLTKIGLMRGGQKVDLSVQMIAPPESAPRDETTIGGHNPLSGAKIANLSPAVAAQMGIPDAEVGVVVVGIKENANAAIAGIQPGDILAALNGKPVSKVADVLSLLGQQTTGFWRMTLVRDGETLTISLRASF